MSIILVWFYNHTIPLDSLKLWLLAVSKLFNQQFQLKEGVTLFSIIGEVLKFIVYCLLLFPAFILHARYVKETKMNLPLFWKVVRIGNI